MNDDKRITVLDHGYVELVESWGSDERIIEAARMSTDGGFRGWGPIHDTACRLGEQFTDPVTEEFVNFECSCEPPWPKSGDEKLLSYLYKNQHATPFEMAGAVFEVAAPIFVFREWHRHRTQSYNEMSARYSPLPDVNYIPSVDRLLVSSAINKQASTVAGAPPLDESGAHEFQRTLEMYYRTTEARYQQALQAGVPKELARIMLPVGRYSKMRASANLRNWLAFLTLRCDTRAQWEIRQYANVVATLLCPLFPRTMELWGAYEATLTPRETPIVEVQA